MRQEEHEGWKAEGLFYPSPARASSPEIHSSPVPLALARPQAGRISSKPHLLAYF